MTHSSKAPRNAVRRKICVALLGMTPSLIAYERFFGRLRRPQNDSFDLRGSLGFLADGGEGSAGFAVRIVHEFAVGIENHRGAVGRIERGPIWQNFLIWGPRGGGGHPALASLFRPGKAP